MRILRFCLGLLLLPVCVAVTQTAISLMKVSQVPSVTTVPLSALSLGGGFLLWLILYFTTPPPARTYVLAHELTHALWGSMMGATISSMKISKEKGSVTLSKSNFIITLAPYFFPLYTVMAIIAYYILSMFRDMGPYYLCWLGLVGFTWGFHFTFTITALMQRQTDIKEYGHLFSYTVIYICNVFGIALWIVAVSTATFEQMIGFIAAHTIGMAVLTAHGLKYLWLNVVSKLRK